MGLVCLSLAPSCGDNADACGGSFRVSAGIPAPERVVLERAARGVNEFIGEERIVISEDGVCPIVKGALTKKTHGGDYVGYWKRDAGLTFDLDDTKRSYPGDKYWRMLYGAAMHEYLHSLGLRHIVERGIMHPEVTWSDVFTEADRDECRRADVCS